jgi:hypothetical protein
MDVESSSLVGQYGHCNQEMLNLLLTGCASSNIFDGEIPLGDGLFIRGVTKRSQIGYLTHLEALRHCQVIAHV